MIKYNDWNDFLNKVYDAHTDYVNKRSLEIIKGGGNRAKQLMLIYLSRYVKALDLQNVKPDTEQIAAKFKDYDEADIKHTVNRINMILGTDFEAPIVYHPVLDDQQSVLTPDPEPDPEPVIDPLIVSPVSLNLTEGQAVNINIVASGGVSPYTWSISNSSLPTGLVLNSQTGNLQGTPSVNGNYNFTIRVTDSRGVFNETIVNGSIIAAKQYVTFATTGSAFAPRIELNSDAPVDTTIEWSLDNAVLNTTASPNLSFDTSATRNVRLNVTPWSALKGINLGYDAADGGNGGNNRINVPLHPTQPVNSVEGLDIVRTTLQYFCGNGTNISSLDFRGFSSLGKIEMFGASNLDTLLLAGNTALYRFCVESTRIAFTDFSEAVNMEDYRGAVTLLTETRWGTSGSQLWHYCCRQHRNTMTVYPPVNDHFPLLREMWIEGNGHTGHINPLSKVLTSVWLNNNNIQSLTLRDCPNLGTVYIHSNALLTTITVDNCPNLNGDIANIMGCNTLVNISITNCNWSIANQNTLITALINSGRTNGTLNLSGNITLTDTSGLNTLISRGWTINGSVPALDITTHSLNAMTIGSAFNQTLSIVGGVNPYTWAISAGSLPTGLSLNSATGVISGTPTVSGLYNVTITATDTLGSTNSQIYSDTVGEVQVQSITIVNDTSAYGVGVRNVPQPTLNLTVGNTVLACVSSYESISLSLTDNLGNVYTGIPGTYSNGEVDMQFFISTVTVGGLATFSMTGQVYEYNCIYAMQLSGIKTSNPVDAVSFNQGRAQSKTIGTITTTQANEILIMSFHSNEATNYIPVPNDMIKLAGTSGLQRPIYYKLLPDIVSNLVVGVSADNTRIWDASLVTLKGN